MELKFCVSYRLVVVCVSTIEMGTGPFKVSKHEMILHETVTQLFSQCIVFYLDVNK